MFESAHCNIKREKETVKSNEDDEKLVVMQQEACRFLKRVLVLMIFKQDNFVFILVFIISANLTDKC